MNKVMLLTDEIMRKKEEICSRFTSGKSAPQEGSGEKALRELERS